jgi:hypothetical protein
LDYAETDVHPRELWTSAPDYEREVAERIRDPGVAEPPLSAQLTGAPKRPPKDGAIEW